MLDSLRAPATPGELAREQDALTSFHRAHLERAYASSPRTGRVGLKAALASAGAVALLSSGIAALAWGHAPWLNPAATSAASSSRTAVLSESAHPTPTAHHVQPSGPSDKPSAHTTGPDARAFPGLCRAYLSGNKSEHGKALASPAFSVLVSAAGGADNVAAFCGVITTGPSASHSAHPSHPAHPTQAASPTHPTHPSHPTQAASPTHPAHPTHPPRPTQAASPSHASPTHPQD